MSPTSEIRTDAQFGVILASQRAAFLRDGPPSLGQRRADLKKLRAALIAQRPAIEAAVNADFGHRSRHETAMMEIMALLMGIDYLHRNLRRFMRPTHRHVALPSSSAGRASSISRSASSASCRHGTIPSRWR
jgi:coniferyl-aldehyde dehydrogenase